MSNPLLDYAAFKKLTGLPRRAHEEWLIKTPRTRKDIIEIYSDRDELAQVLLLCENPWLLEGEDDDDSTDA